MITIKNELGINNMKKLLIIMITTQEIRKVIIDVMKNPTMKKKAREMQEKKRLTHMNIQIREEKSKTEVKKKIMILHVYSYIFCVTYIFALQLCFPTFFHRSRKKKGTFLQAK